MRESFITPLLLALLFVGVTLGISSVSVSERTQLAQVGTVDLTTQTNSAAASVPVTYAVTVSADIDCASGASRRTVGFFTQPTTGGYFSLYGPGGTDFGDREPGLYDLPVGVYTWEGKARAGYVRAGTYTGSLSVLGECPTQTTTTGSGTTTTGDTSSATIPPPPTPSTTLIPVTVSVSVGSTCTIEKGMTQVAVAVEPGGAAMVSFRKENGNMITSTSQGLAYLPNGAYTWTVEARPGYRLAGASSGTLALSLCPTRVFPRVSIGSACDPIEEGVPLTFTLGGEGTAYLSLVNVSTKETLPLVPGTEYLPNGSYTWSLVAGGASPVVFDGATSGSFTVSACTSASAAPYVPPKAGTLLFFRDGKLIDPLVRQGEKIAVRVDISGVTGVELERVGKDTREVLGRMTKDDGTNRWLFAWDVGRLLPGEYDIVARSYGAKGGSISGSRLVTVLPLSTVAPSPISATFSRKEGDLDTLPPIGDVPVPEEPVFDRLKTDITNTDAHLSLPVRGVADLISTEDILSARNTLPDVVRSPEDLRIFCATEANDDVCFEFLPEALREEAKKAVEESRQEIARALGDRPRTVPDMDQDGISDFDESHFYGTDPTKADSDGDGKSDQKELTDLDDPLRKTTTVAPLAFEDPSFGGEERADLFVVTDVRASTSTETRSTNTATPILLSGKALPHSIVTIYVYSDPIIVRVQTDGDGLWSYTLARELPDGSHKAYVAMTDSAGRVLAKSAPLPFVKTAAAVSVTRADLPGTTPSAPSLFSGASLYAVILILFGVVGFAVLAIGVIVRSRQNDSVIP